jgi:hypothetical protein
MAMERRRARRTWQMRLGLVLSVCFGTILPSGNFLLGTAELLHPKRHKRFLMDGAPVHAQHSVTTAADPTATACGQKHPSRTDTMRSRSSQHGHNPFVGRLFVHRQQNPFLQVHAKTSKVMSRPACLSCDSVSNQQHLTHPLCSSLSRQGRTAALPRRLEPLTASARSATCSRSASLSRPSVTSARSTVRRCPTLRSP